MTVETFTERMTITSVTPAIDPAATDGTHRLAPHAAGRRLVAPLQRPAAELPGLVLAIDELRGPVTRLVLAAESWDSHPRRLGVHGRVLRLGYFTSQPVSLLTAICGNDRVDLLVVPANTASGTADAAMILAATTNNLVHAQHILLAVSTPTPHPVHGVARDAWEAEGRRRGPIPAPVGQRPPACQGTHGLPQHWLQPDVV
ncbi:hypothetical protein KBX50_12245 [Micromonospora sp. C51]|nr:DUF5994 family protein [Micromonospora sp. C51]MBQ1049229.1 hypothetical protein [Micromonospora sp. C51]